MDDKQLFMHMRRYSLNRYAAEVLGNYECGLNCVYDMIYMIT